MSLHGYSDGEYDDASDVDNVTLISKLDVSHSLHLHPNDFLALTIVSVKLKGTENYQVWSNTDEVLGRQWDRVNAMVLGWILNSISEELFLGQIILKRAKHVWDELKETYDKVDGSVTFSLHHKIHTLSQNGSSIADYYHKLNALWKQFDALIESSILSRETLPDVRNAYAFISSEESHRIATGNFQRSQTSTSFSRLHNNNRPNDNGNMRTARGSALVCENYGFNGHTIDKCFKIIRYPADFRKRKAGSNLKRKNVSNNVVGSSSSNGFFDEQMATLISLIKENSINGKGVHSNMAGTYMNSSTVFNKNFEKFFCSNSSLHSKLVSKGLITDSVTHPNGTGAFITRIGNMPLTDYMTLYDVLVVLEYCVSLMSVHKVARDSKLVIAFNEMHCYVMNQDLRKGKILGTDLVILLTKLPTSMLNGKSPYDLVYNKPPSLNHLRSFSCLAYATILNSHDKFGSRSEKYVLVRYSNSKKGYKLWSLDNKQIIYSRDVKFFEDIFPFKQNNSNEIANSVQDVNHLNFFNNNTLDDLPEIPNDEERRNPSLIRHGNSPFHSGSTSAFSNENDAGHSQDADDSASENGSFAADEQNNSNSEGNDLHDQSQDNVSQDINGAQNLRTSSRTSGVEPKTYLEAYQHKHWVNAMNAEMDVLYRNNTWEIVDLLVGRKAIGSKWVWKIKYKSDGEIERYKASYVDDIIITGNSLTEIEKVKQFLKTKFMIKDLRKLKYFLGIEVLDTPKGICLNQRKYCLELIDEFGLLAGKPSNLPMQPNIYLTSEPSDADPLFDNVTEYQKLIGKLIYLTTTRPDIAYTVSCLSHFMPNPLRSHLKTALKVIRYLKGSPGKGINVIKGSASSIDLKAYSDADWARCADTRRSITGYCVFMCGLMLFPVRNLGKLKYFLGIEVLDTPKGICLNQRKYCLELIDEFGLLAGKPSNLPMQPNISLSSKLSDVDPLPDNVTEYQKLIGKLIYLTTTRPDIAYIVSCLSQFMHNPLRSHLKTALKVIRYLKGSPGKGINVIKGYASSIDLKAYSDAD
ncbi:ribonuclease H-like domain-containing protein [Tanacetum coccineum]